MDLYHPNPTTLGRLLTKRQNPCTQIFKAQPSNPTNVPMSTINLARNDISASHDEKSNHFSAQNSTPNFFAPNNNFQSPIQTSLENPLNQAQSPESTTIVDEDDDDAAADCYEKVEKKLKTATFVTTELRSRRNSSFEEEKEESDHSTSCETRSDFFNACETGDHTPFSPPMTHQKEPSDLKLDGSEGNLRSCGLNCNFGSQDSGASAKKAQEIAQTIGENLSNLIAGGSKKMRCKLNHQWEIDLSSISKKGCSRCSDLLEECREFARKNQGSCLNEEYDETIRYRCIKGHIWNLNYKNARRRWCAQCAKEQRAFLKKKCEEEKLEREKQDEAYQKKLFEEARKKAMQENSPKPSFSSAGQSAGNGGSKPISLLEYFQRIDYEIESLAKKYTVKFMEQKEFGGELTYQQILQVYKISIMPEEVLQTYMFNLTIDTLKAEFRRMAKIIHPDKNKHPQAGNAFQKIYKVYEVALSRLEGPQQKI